MPRLSRTTADGHVRVLEVETADGPLKLHVVLERLTGADDDAMAAAAGDPDPSTRTAKILAQTKSHILKATVGWDLTDDDGAELPVTLEVLNQLPGAIHARILEALQEAMRPPLKRSNSGDGS